MAKQYECILVLLGLVIGCDAPRVKTVPVSGAVKLNRQPVANVGVAFLPLDSVANVPGSSGFTDSAGRYELRVNKTTERGTAVGKHRVVMMRSTGLSTGVAEPQPTFQELPDRYNIKSELIFDVPPGGTTTANFDLSQP